MTVQINEIAKTVGEMFAFFRGLTDPEKRKKAYELHLDKRRNIALEYAEKIIFENEKYINFLENRLKELDQKEITLKEWHQKTIKKYKEIFFKYN